jgi:hypothetical protein
LEKLAATYMLHVFEVGDLVNIYSINQNREYIERRIWFILEMV